MASELKLPGTFEEGKKVLWKGADAKAWKRALEEDRIIAGTGLTEVISAKGRTLSVTPESGGGGGTTSGVNMNISVYSLGENSSGISGPSTLQAVIYIRNGLIVGTTDPGGTPSALIEISVSNFAGYIS